MHSNPRIRVTRVLVVFLAVAVVAAGIISGLVVVPRVSHALGLAAQVAQHAANPNASLSCPAGTPVSTTPVANGNGLGLEPWYTYHSQLVNDRKSYSANVASGNLVF